MTILRFERLWRHIIIILPITIAAFLSTQPALLAFGAKPRHPFACAIFISKLNDFRYKALDSNARANSLSISCVVYSLHYSDLLLIKEMIKERRIIYYILATRYIGCLSYASQPNAWAVCFHCQAVQHSAHMNGCLPKRSEAHYFSKKLLNLPLRLYLYL